MADVENQGQINVVQLSRFGGFFTKKNMISSGLGGGLGVGLLYGLAPRVYEAGNVVVGMGAVAVGATAGLTALAGGERIVEKIKKRRDNATIRRNERERALEMTPIDPGESMGYPVRENHNRVTMSNFSVAGSVSPAYDSGNVYAGIPVSPSAVTTGNPLRGSLKKGGDIKKTGIYKLHKGELVIPANKVKEVKKKIKKK